MASTIYGQMDDGKHLANIPLTSIVGSVKYGNKTLRIVKPSFTPQNDDEPHLRLDVDDYYGTTNAPLPKEQVRRLIGILQTGLDEIETAKTAAAEKLKTAKKTTTAKKKVTKKKPLAKKKATPKKTPSKKAAKKKAVKKKAVTRR